MVRQDKLNCKTVEYHEPPKPETACTTRSWNANTPKEEAWLKISSPGPADAFLTPT